MPCQVPDYGFPVAIGIVGFLFMVLGFCLDYRPKKGNQRSGSEPSGRSPLR